MSNIPWPFDAAANDIINIFNNTANSLGSLFSSFYNNELKTAFDPIMKVILVPVEAIDSLDEPFISLYNTIDAYTLSWTDPIDFIETIIDAMIYIYSFIKVIGIITPEVFTRIVYEIPKLNLDLIRKSYDYRILRQMFKMYPVTIEHNLNSFDIVGNYSLGSISTNLEVFKTVKLKQLKTFQLFTEDKFMFISLVLVIFVFAFTQYYKNRWMKSSL